MRRNKAFVIVLILNLFFSLLVVYLSPRFDIVTLLSFVVVNCILFFLIRLIDNKERNILESKIDEMFNLLHSLKVDSKNYEVVDDEFGKLRDEIVKIIIENKIVANKAMDNQYILKEYTEDIAHQIKTPLTEILLILDLIEEDKFNFKEYEEYIRNSVERLNNLADILLKMASLDSGILEMKKERVSIMELIDDVLLDIKGYFINDKINISTYGDDFILLCDEKWTYEAIYNIVKNAIEASMDKGIEIHLKKTNLYKSVIIKDFGKGLSNEMLKKAYRRFYKENPNSKGYGIGLPMAKSIMEKQNGELLYFRERNFNYFELRFYI